MINKLNILHTVEFYHPSVGGAQETVRQLSEHMALLGHDVTVATTRQPDRNFTQLNKVKIEEFDISGNLARGISGEKERYQKYLVSNKFDIILNYAAQQWTTDLTFQILDKIKSKKIIVPCGYSGLHNNYYQRYFNKLPKYLHKYDASVYMSDSYQDIEFARQHNIQNLYVIPNAANEREFDRTDKKEIANFRGKYGIDASEKLFITVGSHTGIKGHKECIFSFYLANTGPATLMIIGNGTKACLKICNRSAKYSTLVSNLTKKRVITPILSREDTVTAFKSADIFLFLSNVECSPLVLFESAASGVPFICSEAGNSAEIAAWTKAGLIVRTRKKINGFVYPDILHASQIISKLCNNKDLCKTLGSNGRKTYKSKFSWAKVTKEYEKLYTSLLEKDD